MEEHYLKTVRDVCKYVGRTIKNNPVCIETGCTYTMPPGNEIHTTTNNICEYIVSPLNGMLYSLDIDKDHILYASNLEAVVEAGEHIEFMVGDSVNSLNSLRETLVFYGRGVDFICFDSKEFDEDHMVNEFNAIVQVLSKKHFILVDDIHNLNSVKYKKLVPILKELYRSYFEVPTPTGMFVVSGGC